MNIRRPFFRRFAPALAAALAIAAQSTSPATRPAAGPVAIFPEADLRPGMKFRSIRSVSHLAKRGVRVVCAICLHGKALLRR